MILKTAKQKNYELIDSGNGEKLERYGEYLLSRPDPEALWKKMKEPKIWDEASLIFSREGNMNKWIIKDKVDREWVISYGGYNFSIRPNTFKHTGLFPEQLPNWEWMVELIRSEKSSPRPGLGADSKKRKSLDPAYGSKPISVLNLFAYTGGATLACAQAGAEVCHVDGSKSAVTWARENAKLSGLESAPIRWIIEDVISFLKREIKRGRVYDAIIMDPPSFGHGPKDELWKIEEHFLELIDLCRKVLSDDPLFVVINGYTAGYSAIVYENNLKDMMKDFKGKIEIGELAIEESESDRLLPCGIFARWGRN